MKDNSTLGTLYLVATPIGHLGDVTDRARAVLGSVAVVAAEDTRRSGRLMQHLGLSVDLQPYHEHNAAQQAPRLIRRLQAGDDVALVSDAGTPLVSDPGYRLVDLAHAAGLPVVPVPGASAVLAALCAAGLATDRWCFEGFLPVKPGARARRLEDLAREARTMVLFEAPHRLAEVLDALAGALGADRPATLARELTKQYETIRRATLGELAAWVRADPDQQRGEVVLVVAGAPVDALPAADLDRVLVAALAELPPSAAARLAAGLTGVPRKQAYAAAQALRERAGSGSGSGKGALAGEGGSD